VKWSTDTSSAGRLDSVGAGPVGVSGVVSLAWVLKDRRWRRACNCPSRVSVVPGCDEAPNGCGGRYVRVPASSCAWTVARQRMRVPSAAPRRAFALRLTR